MSATPFHPIGLCGALMLASCAACFARDLAVDARPPLPAVIRAIDDDAIRELRRAWIMAHAGAAAFEQVVVVTGTTERGYAVVLQPHANRYGRGAFTLPEDIAAVFHTHPDRVQPAPSSHDCRLADRTGVPVFTMSSQGLFVYDPATKTVSKLLDRLQWLSPSSWRLLAAIAR